MTTTTIKEQLYINAPMPKLKLPEIQKNQAEKMPKITQAQIKKTLRNAKYQQGLSGAV